MRRTILVALAVAGASLTTTPAGAHIERDPQFQDPAPDTSIFPPAGGDFPRYREHSLPAVRPVLFRRYVRAAFRNRLTEAERRTIRHRFARLSDRQQRRALRWMVRLRERRGMRRSMIATLRLPDRSAFESERLHVVCQEDSMRRLRAGMDLVELSPRARRRLLRNNRRFAERCRYDEIQPAINAADNNDIVVIMPGFYTEPTARAQPHGDPRCAHMTEESEGGSGAVTYEYHFTCPNDINMIAVIGRDLEGNCIRCNLQVEGSGARPEDVIVEGQEGVPDPGVRRSLFDLQDGQKPAAKENTIRVERADGIYLRNFTVRGGSHNGLYGNETDGMTVSKVKGFWAHEYDFLNFVTDHLLMKYLEAAGSSDAGVYPGAAPPSRPRLNTIITKGNFHHNALGFSGTMGSNVHIVDNDFHHNSTGISMDSFYRSGHPGFPQHGTVIERNRIYSNNFNTYEEGTKVPSSVPVPVGVGFWIVGGNDNLVKDNWIYDNWRHAGMLITVPDVLSNQLRYTPGPSDAKLSTSHRNRFEGNHLDVAPDGTHMPNGVDYWWDELGQGNCWQEDRERMTSDPPNVPDCDDHPNVGAANPVKEAQLAHCAFLSERQPDEAGCDWWTTPEKPE